MSIIYVYDLYSKATQMPFCKLNIKHIKLSDNL